MSKRDSNTRRIVRGKQDKSTGVYLLTLDTGQVVETQDVEIALQAREAMQGKLPVLLTLEQRRNMRPLLLELSVAETESGDIDDDLPPPEQEPPDDYDEPPPVPDEDDAPPTRRASGPPARRPAQKPAVLARVTEMPTGLIVDPQALNEQLGRMSETCHVLSTPVAYLNPGWGANLAMVKIDPTVEKAQDGKSAKGPDCYWSKRIHQHANERSLSKEGLAKFANAFGIIWQMRRLDDRRIPFLWHYEAHGAFRQHDGTWKNIVGSKELDLRDGSAEAAGMASPRQLAQARIHGNQLCETKAQLRAVRSIGIKQTFTVEELAKPFLIVRYSFQPDMDDPAIKRLVTERALEATAQLFPTAQRELLPSPPDPKPIDPFEGLDQGEEPVGALPAADPTTTEDPNMRMVVDVKTVQTGRNRNGDWTLYHVVVEGGEFYSTFDDLIAKEAAFAKEQGWPVRLKAEPSEKYPDRMNLLELKAVDPRQGTLI